MSNPAGRMILKGDWRRSLKVVGQYGKHAKGAIDKAAFQEALYYLQMVNKVFVKGGITKKWPRLSKITRDMRRNMSKVDSGAGSHKGTKPLMRSGSLRRSLNVKKQGYGTYFVGVHRTAKRGGYNAKAYPLVNIAAVHEYGQTIVVTRKMRGYFRYLAAKGVIKAPLKKSTRVLIIPQRSYLNDAMDAWKGGHETRLLQRVAQNMGLIKGVSSGATTGSTSSGGARGSGGSSTSSGSIG